MQIRRQGQVVIIEDGAWARNGTGVLVPAILVGTFFSIILYDQPGPLRYGIAVLMFVATALVVALLRPPRWSEFDQERREVRIRVGWPALLGRRITVAFDEISDAKVRRLIKLNDLGSARPVLVLKGGRCIFLSAYLRSPKHTREVVEQVRHFLGSGNMS
jgi:hypothetical protein